MKEALLRPSEVPAIRNDFLLWLVWEECLSTGGIERIIDKYRLRLEEEVGMYQEKMRHGRAAPYRSELLCC